MSLLEIYLIGLVLCFIVLTIVVRMGRIEYKWVSDFMAGCVVWPFCLLVGVTFVLGFCAMHVWEFLLYLITGVKK